MNTLHFITPFFAFLIAYLFIPVLRKVASYGKLVDQPNRRKVHVSPVPLVGGISVYLATTLALSLALPFGTEEVIIHKNTFIATSILLLVGVIDDRFDLSAALKLPIQVILAHFIFTQGIKIESLHGLFGIYELSSMMQYSLTIIVIAGTVNAFNLMDGIDGLAAGFAIVGLGVFAVLAFFTQQFNLLLLFVTLIGALVAFLRFNLSQRHKIFMGDAGSLMLGFILVVSGIWLLQVAQNTAQNTTVTLGVVAVLLVPVLDALRVFRGRAKLGKSPFNADKTHLHHLVLDAGLKHKTATLGILGITALILLTGMLSYQLIGLTTSIAVMLLLFYGITATLKLHNSLNSWKKRVRTMESAYSE